MKRHYIVMCRYYTDTDQVADTPLSGTVHTKRFAAYLEMQHAKDNPQYTGEIFYIREVMECGSCKYFQDGECIELNIRVCDDEFTCNIYTRRL